jgi:hypothetical protein
MADDAPEPELSPQLELSKEETQVMFGRYAGASYMELSRSTGLPMARVEAIAVRLTGLGLLEKEILEPIPESPDPHAASDDLVALLDAATFDLMPPVDASGAPPDPRMPSAPPAPLLRRTPPTRPPSEPPPERAGGADAEADADHAPDDPEPAETAERAEKTREYKKLFEAELHPLPTDERVALAGTATGARLFALCFDPVPAVVSALFENAATTVEHARLIAFHHRDARGLEEVVGRPAMVADALVYRRLVRNPALTEAMVRRLLAHRRLAEVYKLSHDRDLPERSRVAARQLFRSKFMTGQPEEKAELVWSTEGRILVALTGITFDSRMTSILCARTYASIMLVQSLARFPATPPALLGHLLRQPLVKRQPQLRNQLLQHGNTPSDVKRKG